MKTLKDNIILLSYILFLFTLLEDKVFIFAMITCLFLWILRTKDHSWILVACLLFIITIPRYSSTYPTMQKGKAITVKGSYSILLEGNEKVIVYTQSPLELDAVYQMNDNFKEIESSSHFYTFNYSSWSHKQGIYYSLNEEDITFHQQTFSFRHCIQTMINEIDDVDKKTLLYKTILNVSLKDNDEEKWFYSNGFTYAGMIAIIECILKFFIDKKRRNIILLLLSTWMVIFYHFPILLVQIFFYQIFKFSHISYKKKTGLITSLLIILYPSEIASISFLLPTLFHYSFLFTKDKKYGLLFFSFMIQSVIFQSLNPLKSILYPCLSKCYGVLHLLSYFDLFLHTSISLYISSFLSVVLEKIELFTLKGSIFGFGMILFIIILFLLRKNKLFYPLGVIILFIFLYTGLFHPFSELTIINVGQGDSILLRSAFNTSNVLIDTGKESAYKSLEGYLRAKGIKDLNALIITHPDEDHNGNQDNLIQDFNVQEVITEHFKEKRFGSYDLKDLNAIQNGDTNQSSIVNAFEFHGKQVCLMGDSDQITEQSIINSNSELSCDILKVSHHGSKTGSSDKFLDTVRPKIALISSGSYSIYHHPSEEVIQKLLKRHIPYLDTKTRGDITIISIFQFNVLITSNFEIALL